MSFNLGITLYLPKGFSDFSDIAITANACVNPFIYAFKYEEFQTRVKTFFHSIFGTESQKREEGNV